MSIRFFLAKDRLQYLMKVAAATGESITVLDMAVFIPMNSRFEWAVKAQERVILHSFVSGDGSFIYFTHCDGEPPFLVCRPHAGTRLEMYDVRLEVVQKPVYRAFLHAVGDERTVAGMGCAWRHPVSRRDIIVGEAAVYGFDFLIALGYDGVREVLYECGKPDILLAPGMTLPRSTPTRMRVRMKDKMETLDPEFPAETTIEEIARDGASALHEITLQRLGENRLNLRYGCSKYSVLEIFVTLPVEDLIVLRGGFYRKPSNTGCKQMVQRAAGRVEQ